MDISNFVSTNIQTIHKFITSNLLHRTCLTKLKSHFLKLPFNPNHFIDFSNVPYHILYFHCKLNTSLHLLFPLIFSPTSTKAAGFKHCTKQGMTATASNRRHRCWGNNNIIIIIIKHSQK